MVERDNNSIIAHCDDDVDDDDEINPLNPLKISVTLLLQSHKGSSKVHNLKKQQQPFT